MSSEDPLLDSFQQWQLGIVLLFVVIFVASVSATALQTLGVPYGGWIGGVGGAVLTFLAISYWYYGR
jgi:uncharacterized membrane protein YdcZ (DUF606 family)